eukprot:scaffold225818_cov16-Tisochrysis_lutea.AAC.1
MWTVRKASVSRIWRRIRRRIRGWCGGGWRLGRERRGDGRKWLRKSRLGRGEGRRGEDARQRGSELPTQLLLEGCHLDFE